MAKNKAPKEKKPRRRLGSTNSQLMALIVSGSLLFALIVYVVVRSNVAISAYVPAQSIKAGTRITEDMLKQVRIPAGTPTGYITDPRSLVNQKLKIDVQPNELIYATNVQTNINLFGNDVKIPKNYVIATVNIPDERAVGGILSTGDSVDIAGIPQSNFQSTPRDTMQQYLGNMGKDSFGTDTGVNGFWVLNNVKILQSSSSAEVAAQANSKASSNSNDSNNQGQQEGSVKTAAGTYVMALSYADYKKLLISQQYLDLYLNKAPQEGYKKKEILKGNDLQGLNNAAKQQIEDKKESK